MNAENCDLIMWEPPYDRQAGLYECKSCCGEYDYKSEDTALAYCPSCGKPVARIFDVQKGLEEREAKRRRWPMKRACDTNGRWSVVTTEESTDDWGNPIVDTYDHGAGSGWAFGNREKLDRLIDSRDSIEKRGHYATVEIVRHPPERKPNLPA